ncbi:MAG: hypothetical protein ABIL09_13245 [Gemmatimonadota bacterium]
MVPVLLLLLALALPALPATVRELDSLRLEQAVAAQQQDSLIQDRAGLLRRGARVSELIDSLKVTAPGSGELTESKLRAMELNLQLSRVNQQLEGLEARRDSLRARLRTAYDWEISRLFGMLVQAWDEGLLQQVVIYQEERQALGFDVAGPEMRYGPDMSIAAGDGPEEIEQKVELMGDKLHMVRQDLGLVEGRLQELNAQVALLGAVIGPRADGAEDLATTMRERRGARLSPDGEPVAAELQPAVGPPPRRGLQARAPQGTAPEDLTVPGVEGPTHPVLQPLLLEMRALAARRQELREAEAVYTDRMATFEARRQELLDGRE